MKLILALLLFAAPAFSQFGNATRIWNRPIDSATPTDGYALVWSSSQAKWIFALNGVAIGGTNGQVQYNSSSALGGVTVGGLPTNSITVSGNATQASVVSSCIDKSVVYSTDLTTASGTVSVTVGTAPAHWIWTDVWARETVTFAGTSMTTSTVSIGPVGSETNILPTVSLKQSTNTVTANAVGYAPSDSATAIVAQFVITSGGGTWNNASAGTYDLRVCGHAGR